RTLNTFFAILSHIYGQFDLWFLQEIGFWLVQIRMGKSSGKKKKQSRDKSDTYSMSNRVGVGDNIPKTYDKDTEVFIGASQELKDEGNKLFQRRDYEGSLLKYEKALKLLPRNHIDVAHIRSNMAACYIQMGICDYPRAVHECNLALEVSPNYSKALIKRARCYEGLNRFELALRDINSVLSVEPHNLTALEILERLKHQIESQTGWANGNSVPNPVEYEAPCASPDKPVKERTKKKKCGKSGWKKFTDLEEIKKEHSKVKAENKEDKKVEDKLVVEEKLTDKEDDMKKTVKLVYGEDIRWAHLPVNCSLLRLREVILDRYPNSKPLLIKYKDHEGDMVTITSDEELRWAEASTSSEGSVRLYIVEVDPEQDPFFEKLRVHDSCVISENDAVNGDVKKSVEVSRSSTCMDEWIIQFAQFFRNYVGFSSDAYLDLHEIGVKLYSEAIEETVTSEEAQGLFDMAATKFQEMTALALFNWGNVHMARARKKVNVTEESPKEYLLSQVKHAYEWAEQEYVAAGKRYEEALRTKPDFYEARLALALQQFEQAKLAWYYALANDVDLDTWSYTEVLELYNNAETNIEKGMQMWGELEQQLVDNDLSENELAEQAAKISSQINVLWGSLLYERSIVEYKLQLPVWQECLEVAIEKFQLTGASQSELAVMIKNHCSNDSAIEGVGFKLDEIVQAWNEMDEAKRLYSSVPSFRMEPLLKRRASKLYYALELA
ncbi:hypothetical protein V2J09_017918, partial [Rumex salicifolius]